MANSFIYPKNNPRDLLEFQYHPDKHTEKFRLLGGDSDHPTRGRSVSQLTGRASPSFTFSTMWDSLDTGAKGTFDLLNPEAEALNELGELDSEFDAEDAALAGTPNAGGPAGRAYAWVVRNVGPRGRVDPDTAPIFVLKLIGQPMQVRITDVDVDHEFITRPTGGTKAPARVLRFKANFSGTQFFDSVVDTRLFNVVRKVVKRKKPPKKSNNSNVFSENQDIVQAAWKAGSKTQGVRYTTELAEIKDLQRINREAGLGVTAIKQYGDGSLTEERQVVAVQEGIRQNEQRINALAGRVGPVAIVEDFVKSVASTPPSPIDTAQRTFSSAPVAGAQVADAVELLALVPIAASGVAGRAQLDAEAFPTPPSVTDTGSAFSDQAVAEELAKVNAFTDAYGRVDTGSTPVPEPTKLNMPTLMLMAPLDAAPDTEDINRIQMPALMLMPPLDVTAPDPEDTENVTVQYPLPPPGIMTSGDVLSAIPNNAVAASFQPDNVGPPAPEIETVTAQYPPQPGEQLTSAATPDVTPASFQPDDTGPPVPEPTRLAMPALMLMAPLDVTVGGPGDTVPQDDAPRALEWAPAAQPEDAPASSLPPVVAPSPLGESYPDTGTADTADAGSYEVAVVSDDGDGPTAPATVAPPPAQEPAPQPQRAGALADVAAAGALNGLTPEETFDSLIDSQANMPPRSTFGPEAWPYSLRADWDYQQVQQLVIETTTAAHVEAKQQANFAADLRALTDEPSIQATPATTSQTEDKP